MIRLLTGDCRKVLKDLEDESIHCCVTSPPYFGLRDYGTATWEGGDAECDHSTPRSRGDDIKLGDKQGTSAGSRPNTQRECVCGATHIDSQIGLEPTPQAYVEQLVEVFREVRRVLRDDGTVWLNLGDSYNASPGQRKTTDKIGEKQATNGGSNTIGSRNVDGLKPKDLIGIPWRVAFALQADGWYLRQDIIWAKPNPMPESVTDRCTKAHEYIFLMSKSARYYYDADAIAEPVTQSTVERISQPSIDDQEGSWRVPGKTNGAMKAVVKRSGNKQRKDATERGCPSTGVDGSIPWEGTTRNKRSVWEVATQPYSEAHFATFPPALIEPCILAGCPNKCCAKCGAPWERQTEMSTIRVREGSNTSGDAAITAAKGSHGANSIFTTGEKSLYKTIGFASSCQCNAETASGTVLDPFSGAGTTGLVADRLGRNAILVELNEKYAAMAERRIRDDAGMFAELEGWTPRANSQVIIWTTFVSTLCLSHGYLSMFTNAPVIWIC